MCFDAGDGYAEVYSQWYPSARKEHRCGECHEPIPVGDLYQRGSGIFDGSPFDVKSCGACELLRLRVHEREIARGCEWSESWAPFGDGVLRQYAENAGMPVPTREEGQAYLRGRKTKEAKTKPVKASEPDSTETT